MRFFALTLALATSAPSFAAPGLCNDSNLPSFSASDSIHAIRAKLFSSGFFPIYSAEPSEVPADVRRLGFFEFSACMNGRAFTGCYADWLTTSGERVTIAFPAEGQRAAFLADCPARMRD